MAKYSVTAVGDIVKVMEIEAGDELEAEEKGDAQFVQWLKDHEDNLWMHVENYTVLNDVHEIKEN